MSRLAITDELSIGMHELELTSVRARGAGGQHINKVSSAVHLRFDVRASSLPEKIKMRLLARADTRLTDEGVLVIKAQEFRSQEQNRTAALNRLAALIREAAVIRKVRRPTKPGKAAGQRRLDAKRRRAHIKLLRRKPEL
ncbi:MAG: aminoacyl-tRNA hydrolase [Desulfobulbus sp.]|nr:aminoacyl-tRNA hydrolase [Desulfobulbus sp.]